MNRLVKPVAVVVLMLGLDAGIAQAQSVSISPSGAVRIGGDNEHVGEGRETAPGQMKKEFGGSATDYAPGQQKKGGSTILFGEDKDGRNGKSNSHDKDKSRESGWDKGGNLGGGKGKGR